MERAGRGKLFRAVCTRAASSSTAERPSYSPLTAESLRIPQTSAREKHLWDVVIVLKQKCSDGSKYSTGGGMTKDFGYPLLFYQTGSERWETSLDFLRQKLTNGVQVADLDEQFGSGCLAKIEARNALACGNHGELATMLEKFRLDREMEILRSIGHDLERPELPSSAMQDYRRPSDGNALHSAASMGYAAAVSWLLKLPSGDVMCNSRCNKIESNGNLTPLHLAAENCDVEVVHRLLQHGSLDVNSTDGANETALHRAAEMEMLLWPKWVVDCDGNLVRKDLEVGKLLLEAGCDATIRGMNNKTQRK